MIFTKRTGKDMITYITLIKVDGRLVRLSYSKLIPYLTTKQVNDPKFTDTFLFRKEAYTNKKVDNKELNHAMYNWIRETNYSKLTDKWHEIQWDEIKVENKGHFLIISDSKRSYTCAVPPTDKTRYDFITVDGRYHYDCTKNQFEGIDAIEIFLNEN